MIPTDRRDESRAIIVKAFYFALGSYMEQEAKKNDQWRDQNLGQLFAHTSHEMEEIRKNINEKMPMTYLLHNCVDLVGLSCMLLADVMMRSGIDLKEIENGKTN